MHSATLPDSLRRSSRVPVTVPILVTSLEPESNFSQVCETLVVNAHGCAMRSPVKLKAGAALQFHSKDGREATARVVDCQPIGTNQLGWRLGAKLDQPENFWGLQACPEDWMLLTGKRPTAEQHPPRKSAGNGEVTAQLQSQAAPSVRVVLTKEHLRAMVAEFVQPLHAELTDLKEKLAAGDSRRSRFEVSLSQIPPELQEQLWKRLRQDLSTQVLHYTREQSEQVLGSARITIEQKIAEAQNEFRQQLAAELQAVEQRAQSFSEELADTVRQTFRSGATRFERQVTDAGTRLEERSEALLQSQQQRLGADHDARYRELQELQAAMQSESSRLQAQIADLGSRMAKLDESARRLESDLDARLARMAGEVLSGAHAELENAAEMIVKQLETRNAKALESQLDDACGRLRIIQKGIETSVSESLRSQVADTMQCFEQNVDEIARHSVERWRLALARNLNSLGKILGEQFRLDLSDGNEVHHGE
ncbi:MAG: hypothetical protein LAO03_08390 [Acidobacteriia bacterium]|nr:hypothetical protein [Terriglobia bacterium]